jgi:hypothetical protein
MKHSIKGRTAGVAIATCATVILTSGIAYAFWSTSASGTGQAGVGSSKPILISTTGVTNPADLVPNGTGSVAVKLDNTIQSTTGNNFTVQVSKVNSVSIASDDTSNCPTANLTVNQTLPYTLPSPLSVGANTTTTASIANLVKLSLNAPDTCQGKTFTITLGMS